MASIKFPKRINDNFGDGLNHFFDILSQVQSLSDKEALILDMRECVFLTPFFLLPITLLISKESDKRKVDILFPESKSGIHEYLRSIRFHEGLRPETFPNTQYSMLLEDFSGKNYIPIIDFPADRDSKNIETRDSFLSTVGSIISKQVDLKGQIKTGVLYLIDEAVNNIVDHSGESRGYIFAQYFRANGFLDICIGDCGITILGSYKKGGNLEITSDEDALINSSKGLSTKNRPGAENRGFGISTSLNMLVNGLKGKYALLSGSAILIKTLDREEVVVTPSKLHWQGTILTLRVPYAGNLNFNAHDYYS